MNIHRSRFVPYPPSAINALAFSHTQPDTANEDPEYLRLAIGRANGNIEIWNPAKGAWLLERVFYGGKDRSVEGLAWTQEPDERDENGKLISGKLRLFSIGYSRSVTEWDLATGLPSRNSDGSHSEVWCFAAQPRPRIVAKKNVGEDANSRQNLVAGCADGALVLLSTADNDLRFERFLSQPTSKKARVLSITYKDRNVVLAGFADSTIRVLDTRNRTVLRNISLGSGPPGGPKDILVWKVKCLSNGDFVSGDSTGDIRIYDGKNYSQVQRISGHEADVLDLVVSQDGNMIFSGGMDRRTCLYTCSKKKNNRGERWRKVSHKRYHDHDIKAMATYEGHQLNVIVSGGIDTRPVVLPLREFGRELSRGLPTLPHHPSLISAPEARLMVSWWNCEVRVWRVKDQAEGAERPKVVARIALQGDENIASVSITRDGGLLAVATAKEVKLFQLTHFKSNPSSSRIRKVNVPTPVGARLVRFSAHGKWLAIITSTNEVQLARLVQLEEASARPRVLQRMLCLHRHKRDGKVLDPLNWGQYDRSITHAEFSDDGTVFAVADLAGYIDTWVLEGHEDATAPEVDVEETADASPDSDEDSDDEKDASDDAVTVLGQRWICNPSGHLLPRLDSTPLLLSFQPGSEVSHRPEPNGNPAVHATRNNPHPHSHDLPDTEERLLVVSADHQLYRFEIRAGRLSAWCRRNPPSSYPRQFRLLGDPAKGCTWDTSGGKERLWLYGEKWLFMFDLSKDFPLPGSTERLKAPNGVEQEEQNIPKKRKLGSELPRRITSGAGEAVPEWDTPVTKMRKFNSGKDDESSKSTWLNVSSKRQLAQSDDSFQVTNNSLAVLRRSSTQDGAASTMTYSLNGDAPMTEKEDMDSEVEETRSHEPWWHTFKYRPILGMVPVGGDRQPLEVVLVERPSWDLDLPPRFMGSREE